MSELLGVVRLEDVADWLRERGAVAVGGGWAPGAEAPVVEVAPADGKESAGERVATDAD